MQRSVGFQFWIVAIIFFLHDFTNVRTQKAKARGQRPFGPIIFEHEGGKRGKSHRQSARRPTSNRSGAQGPARVPGPVALSRVDALPATCRCRRHHSRVAGGGAHPIPTPGKGPAEPVHESSQRRHPKKSKPGYMTTPGKSRSAGTDRNVWCEGMQGAQSPN